MPRSEVFARADRLAVEVERGDACALQRRPQLRRDVGRGGVVQATPGDAGEVRQFGAWAGSVQPDEGLVVIARVVDLAGMAVHDAAGAANPASPRSPPYIRDSSPRSAAGGGASRLVNSLPSLP